MRQQNLKIGTSNMANSSDAKSRVADGQRIVKDQDARLGGLIC